MEMQEFHKETPPLIIEERTNPLLLLSEVSFCVIIEN